MSRPSTMGAALPGLWSFAHRVKGHLRRQRLLITGSFGALFAEVGLRILEPWPLQIVIDHVLHVGPGTERARWPVLAELEPGVLLPLSAAALVVVAGLRALAAYGAAVGFALTGNRVLTQVRNELFERLQLLSLRYHHRARSGDLIVRLMGDVGMLKEVAVTAFLPLLGNLLIMVGMLGVMSWLNWRLTLIVFATAPLFLLIALRKGKKIQLVARGQRRREGALATTAAESIGSIHVVQALDLSGRFIGAFNAASSRSLKEGVRAKRLTAGLERSVDVMIALATALALWLGAVAVQRGSLSAGELLVFLAYLKSTFKPVRNFAKYTGRLAKASAAAERVTEVLDEQPEVQDRQDAPAAPAFSGHVVFERIGFAYEPGRSALEDVSFEVRPGEVVALVGRSGSGKSTLANLLIRLYDPTSGRISIDGADIRRWQVASVRRQISIVPQDGLLFAGTIAENIAYARPEAEPAEIVVAARLANAHRFVSRLPEGYETPVGERGVTLSAGQRQRLTIARSALTRAPILVLDEPTTGLDRRNAGQVARALERLARDRATLLITHDLGQVRRADRIVVLERGSVIEQGSHATLLAAGGTYAGLVAIGSVEESGHREGAERAVAF